MAQVLTDTEALRGEQVRFAERDRDGVFHFYSKATFNFGELRIREWAAFISIHPSLDFRSTTFA